MSFQVFYDVNRFGTDTGEEIIMQWREALQDAVDEQSGSIPAPMMVVDSLPDASADVCGPLYLVLGSDEDGSESADGLFVCLKNEDGTYSWQTIAEGTSVS